MHHIRTASSKWTLGCAERSPDELADDAGDACDASSPGHIMRFDLNSLVECCERADPLDCSERADPADCACGCCGDERDDPADRPAPCGRCVDERDDPDDRPAHARQMVLA